MHLICLALLVLILLKFCALVAIPVAKATTCLGIVLVHHICFEPFVGIKVFVVLIEIMGVDLIFEFMSSSTLTTIATCTNLRIVMNLGLLG